jgi:putative transposase
MCNFDSPAVEFIFHGCFLVCIENPALCVGFGKAFSYTKKNLLLLQWMWLPTASTTKGGSMDKSSLAHTTWRCKYHVVFAPKYRRRLIFGKLRTDIGKILRELCKRKEVEIIEAQACPDHIHMLLSIPPKLAVSDFMGYLKGKSSLLIFERHAQLKYKYGNRKFWCKGYYVDTVGRNKEAIEKYIREQLQEDMIAEQLTLKELVDPFTGEPYK